MERLTKFEKLPDLKEGEIRQYDVEAMTPEIRLEVFMKMVFGVSIGVGFGIVFVFADVFFANILYPQ